MYHMTTGPVGDALPMLPIRAASSPVPPSTTDRTLSFEISRGAPLGTALWISPSLRVMRRFAHRRMRAASPEESRTTVPGAADLPLSIVLVGDAGAGGAKRCGLPGRGTSHPRDARSVSDTQARVGHGWGAVRSRHDRRKAHAGHSACAGIGSTLSLTTNVGVAHPRECADKVAWLRPGGRRILRQATTQEPNRLARDEGKSVTKPVCSEADKLLAGGEGHGNSPPVNFSRSSTLPVRKGRGTGQRHNWRSGGIRLSRRDYAEAVPRSPLPG